jgi:hypothetical protein
MITGLRTVDLVAPRVLFTLGGDLRTLSVAAAGEKLGGENNLLEILQRTATALDDLKLAVSSEVFKTGADSDHGEASEGGRSRPRR